MFVKTVMSSKGNAMGKLELVVEDDHHFQVGDTRFRQLRTGDTERMTTREEVLILKNPKFLKRYDDYLSRLPNRNVVEVGIAEGGSLIYFALRYPHLRFVGIDLRASNDAVQYHIDRLGLSDRIKLHYRVDQADGRRLREIVTQEYGGEPLGAVIDDASHFFEQSTKTFEALFGLVAPNGFYCLEDWNWAHEPGRTQDGRLWPDKVSMANLLFRIILLQPCGRDLVRDIHINTNVAFIERGSHPPIQFKVEDLVLNRGKPLGLI
jgi:cephalosporin hydroxylase